MLDEPRHANVIAVGPCKCLSLDRSDFDELLGPLQDVISAQMRIRILRRYDRDILSTPCAPVGPLTLTLPCDVDPRRSADAHSVPLLARLSDRDLDRLARAMRVQQFEDKEYIIREGEVGCAARQHRVTHLPLKGFPIFHPVTPACISCSRPLRVSRLRLERDSILSTTATP